MAEPYDAFDDPVLGRVTYQTDHKEWSFTTRLASGEIFRGTILPEDYRISLREQGLDEIQRRVKWVCEHEPELRNRIAEVMFPGWFEDWYDPEIDTVTTLEGFRSVISLAGCNILEDRNPGLTYNDGNLFGGHAIVLTVGDNGKFIYEPQIWG